MRILDFHKLRTNYQPKYPKIFDEDFEDIALEDFTPTTPLGRDEEIVRKAFENTFYTSTVRLGKGNNSVGHHEFHIGVIFSGGQAPGGHNVVSGIFDGMIKGNKNSRLFGFLGGPSGLLACKYLEITENIIDDHRNTGGFDMLGSGRTKIETEVQFEQSLHTCLKLGLNALVVIGGDDSNTNAAMLAEFFEKKGVNISVIGVPKTIDGDLKNEYVEVSFGFDTATKLYSHLISNTARDTVSAQKHWHFVKLMGRKASHITLECALQTHPNITLISEEIESQRKTLEDIADDISSVVAARAENGEDYGIILIPEGLVEFVPEMKSLIENLNTLLGKEDKTFNSLSTMEEKINWTMQNLSELSAATFKILPVWLQDQLLSERDPHGNIQVSLIETEKLLINLVSDRLEEKRSRGEYSGKFHPIPSFYGYEGRSLSPSNFDADYCYSLGLTAFLLFLCGASGYMASLRGLHKSPNNWIPCGAPLTAMMNVEERHGKDKIVIKKSLVDLNGSPYSEYLRNKQHWAYNTDYNYCCGIQYFGPKDVCDLPTITLTLEALARSQS